MKSTAAGELTHTGRAWVFGDTITTDELYPGFALRMEPAEAARHMFHSLRPGWPDLVRPGDVVIAGRNFGLGSSRAVSVLFRELGVSCLVAEYFNSLFLRNCINHGLLAMTVPGVTSVVTEGDDVTVDLERATWRNDCTGAVLPAKAYPPFVLDLIRSGGVINKLETDGHLKLSEKRL